MSSTEIIQKTLKPYGFDASDVACAKIERYIALLLRWNLRMALTTVTDRQEILKFHFGESLFAAAYLGSQRTEIVDVGSGAGFPGLPLAISDENISVTLLESNAKKAAFLSEAVRELELKNVQVERSRFEDAPGTFSSRFDFVTARALGQFDGLLEWSRGVLKPEGRVALWVGAEDADSLSMNPAWSWDSRLAIPGSSSRFLIFGSRKS